jgi:TonB family protein
MTLLIDLAIRSSLLLAAGVLLSVCLAKWSAALRHQVLAASLLAAICVMPLGLAVPGWTITVPAPAIDAAPPQTPARPLETPARSAHGAPVSPPASESPSLLVIVWLGGVVVFAGALIAGLVRVGRIAASASPVEEERWLRILEAVAARYDLTRDITIARTGSTNLLATWGLLRPQVLVPTGAAEWPLDRVHVVLCHELAHIRRHDWIVQIGAEVVRAVLWFNPLAWIACRRLRRESEQACDDEVLGSGIGAHEYAAHLIELARQCRRRGTPWVSAIPMAHPSTLERRITAMLNPRLDRQAPSRRAMASAGVLLLLVALPVAALRARQAGPAPLSGTVYDVTGGVMPGVEVTLVDANEITWVATSNASGRFEFPPVLPGKYVLRATHPAFRALRHEFELREPRDWTRAVTLQVGELTETIMIRGTREAAPDQQPSRALAEPLRVGGNIRPPRKIKDVRPIYPASMRQAGLTGVVPIEAIIGRDGSVSSVRVLSAQVHPDLAIAAVDAVRRWQFTPTLLNGVAVEVVMTVSVTFDLEG